MARVLDNWISVTASRLGRLPRDHFALFFVYAAERLMPLYVEFAKKHEWGDSAALKDLLDNVWNALSGLPIRPADALQRLEGLAPSGESFDSPDSTYAQDVVICVDAAVRALRPETELDGKWLEYALEPVRTRVSIEKSGFSSIEGDAATEWEMRVKNDPRVAEFMADYERLISLLESSTTLPSAGGLREEARRKAVSAREYLQAE